MKHKHADLIKQWADGAQIQVKAHKSVWEDRENPLWDADSEYRIKPESKPDIVIRFYLESHMWAGHRFSEAYTDNDLINKHSLIKCTFDGETKKLKSVEMI